MITILGAGAFGTALAISLSRNGPVKLWARDPKHVDEMRAARQNARRLPGVDLPDNIKISAELETVSQGQVVLLSVPMQRLRGALETHGAALSQGHLVACCKGMELTTGLGPTRIIAEMLPDTTSAILTGPSFAADIARGLPTALTLACAHDSAGEALQSALSTANLRLYRTTDTSGAELGGALKNVMAIGSGVVMGAGLGESARAALMTRGFAEMSRMAAAVGARPETLSGLSGFGDLVLTCTSEQSRNTRFGLSLGRNESFDPSVTVEGAATARAVTHRAAELGIDMPVTRAITALINGELQVDQAMDMLLSRPLKEE
ncbi:MAG: NAD(P)H-dependent glycerol-3-phosphate dehydrogenase [Pseudomonadota bacterium]|uniref:NAD(P)H-dependent glycerol-3-phosphate dehydrogenase n=1 Tax=Roseovarius TaxID=74030 RepID=UPI0022A7A1BE|nr:NAD(P)H-dependent glycerol-3-phosphate dehydrogenase [Roseovarius sp. EGI FJ00037]MCZ0811214.1 NAD(P)-dependent glycerol-3-phosphate dehydrogenase [Roseovarius sp. EGI FJ00037]